MLAHAGIFQVESSSTKGGLVSGSSRGGSAAELSPTAEHFSNSCIRNFEKTFENVENIS